MSVDVLPFCYIMGHIYISRLYQSSVLSFYQLKSPMNHNIAEVDWLRTQRIRRAGHRGQSAAQLPAPNHSSTGHFCSFTEPAFSTRASQRTQALHLSTVVWDVSSSDGSRAAHSMDSRSMDARSMDSRWIDDALLDMSIAHFSHRQLFCLSAQALARYDLLLLEFAPAQLASALPLLVHLRRATQAPAVVLGDFTCADDRAELLLAGADSVLSPGAPPAVLAGYCRALLRRWISC